MDLSEIEIAQVAQILGINKTEFDEKDYVLALAIAESLPVKHSYKWIGELGVFFQTIEEEKGKIYSELIARGLLSAFLDPSRWTPRIVVPDSVQKELLEERKRSYLNIKPQ